MFSSFVGLFAQCLSDIHILNVKGKAYVRAKLQARQACPALWLGLSELANSLRESKR